MPSVKSFVHATPDGHTRAALVRSLQDVLYRLKQREEVEDGAFLTVELAEEALKRKEREERLASQADESQNLSSAQNGDTVGRKRSMSTLYLDKRLERDNDSIVPIERRRSLKFMRETVENRQALYPSTDANVDTQASQILLSLKGASRANSQPSNVREAPGSVMSILSGLDSLKSPTSPTSRARIAAHVSVTVVDPDIIQVRTPSPHEGTTPILTPTLAPSPLENRDMMSTSSASMLFKPVAFHEIMSQHAARVTELLEDADAEPVPVVMDETTKPTSADDELFRRFMRSVADGNSKWADEFLEDLHSEQSHEPSSVDDQRGSSLATSGAELHNPLLVDTELTIPSTPTSRATDQWRSTRFERSGQYNMLNVPASSRWIDRLLLKCGPLDVIRSNSPNSTQHGTIEELVDAIHSKGQPRRPAVANRNPSVLSVSSSNSQPIGLFSTPTEPQIDPRPVQSKAKSVAAAEERDCPHCCLPAMIDISVRGLFVPLAEARERVRSKKLTSAVVSQNQAKRVMNERNKSVTARVHVEDSVSAADPSILEKVTAEFVKQANTQQSLYTGVMDSLDGMVPSNIPSTLLRALDTAMWSIVGFNLKRKAEGLTPLRPPYENKKLVATVRRGLFYQSNIHAPLFDRGVGVGKIVSRIRLVDDMLRGIEAAHLSGVSDDLFKRAVLGGASDVSLTEPNPERSSITSHHSLCPQAIPSSAFALFSAVRALSQQVVSVGGKSPFQFETIHPRLMKDFFNSILDCPEWVRVLDVSDGNEKRTRLIHEGNFVKLTKKLNQIQNELNALSSQFKSLEEVAKTYVTTEILHELLDLEENVSRKDKELGEIDMTILEQDLYGKAIKRDMAKAHYHHNVHNQVLVGLETVAEDMRRRLKDQADFFASLPRKPFNMYEVDTRQYYTEHYKDCIIRDAMVLIHDRAGTDMLSPLTPQDLQHKCEALAKLLQDRSEEAQHQAELALAEGASLLSDAHPQMFGNDGRFGSFVPAVTSRNEGAVLQSILAHDIKTASKSSEYSKTPDPATTVVHQLQLDSVLAERLGFLRHRPKEDQLDGEAKQLQRPRSFVKAARNDMESNKEDLPTTDLMTPEQEDQLGVFCGDECEACGHLMGISRFCPMTGQPHTHRRREENAYDLMGDGSGSQSPDRSASPTAVANPFDSKVLPYPRFHDHIVSFDVRAPLIDNNTTAKVRLDIWSQQQATIAKESPTTTQATRKPNQFLVASNTSPHNASTGGPPNLGRKKKSKPLDTQPINIPVALGKASQKPGVFTTVVSNDSEDRLALSGQDAHVPEAVDVTESADGEVFTLVVQNVSTAKIPSRPDHSPQPEHAPEDDTLVRSASFLDESDVPFVDSDDDVCSGEGVPSGHILVVGSPTSTTVANGHADSTTTSGKQSVPKRKKKKRHISAIPAKKNTRSSTTGHSGVEVRTTTCHSPTSPKSATKQTADDRIAHEAKSSQQLKKDLFGAKAHVVVEDTSSSGPLGVAVRTESFSGGGSDGDSVMGVERRSSLRRLLSWADDANNNAIIAKEKYQLAERRRQRTDRRALISSQIFSNMRNYEGTDGEAAFEQLVKDTIGCQPIEEITPISLSTRRRSSAFRSRDGHELHRTNSQKGLTNAVRANVAGTSLFASLVGAEATTSSRNERQKETRQKEKELASHLASQLTLTADQTAHNVVQMMTFELGELMKTPLSVDASRHRPRMIEKYRRTIRLGRRTAARQMQQQLHSQLFSPLTSRRNVSPEARTGQTVSHWQNLVGAMGLGRARGSANAHQQVISLGAVGSVKIKKLYRGLYLPLERDFEELCVEAISEEAHLIQKDVKHYFSKYMNASQVGKGGPPIRKGIDIEESERVRMQEKQNLEKDHLCILDALRAHHGEPPIRVKVMRALAPPKETVAPVVEAPRNPLSRLKGSISAMMAEKRVVDRPPDATENRSFSCVSGLSPGAQFALLSRDHQATVIATAEQMRLERDIGQMEDMLELARYPVKSLLSKAMELERVNEELTETYRTALDALQQEQSLVSHDTGSPSKLLPTSESVYAPTENFRRRHSEASSGFHTASSFQKTSLEHANTSTTAPTVCRPHRSSIQIGFSFGNASPDASVIKGRGVGSFPTGIPNKAQVEFVEDTADDQIPEFKTASVATRSELSEKSVTRTQSLRSVNSSVSFLRDNSTHEVIVEHIVNLDTESDNTMAYSNKQFVFPVDAKDDGGCDARKTSVKWSSSSSIRQSPTSQSSVLPSAPPPMALPAHKTQVRNMGNSFTSKPSLRDASVVGVKVTDQTRVPRPPQAIQHIVKRTLEPQPPPSQTVFGDSDRAVDPRWRTLGSSARRASVQSFELRATSLGLKGSLKSHHSM